MKSVSKRLIFKIIICSEFSIRTRRTQIVSRSVDAVGSGLRWTMALPVWKARLLTRIIPPALLPFNRDQVVMSQEDNTCDITKFRDDFDWEPQSFRETLGTYAKEM